MGFTFIASDNAWTDDNGTTQTLNLDIAAGDLIVVLARWEGSDTTVVIADDAPNTYETVAHVINTENAFGICIGYKINAGAKAGATITATLGASKGWRGAVVLQFRPTVGANVSLDASEKSAENTGETTIASQAFATTGDDTNLEVVVGAVAPYGNGRTFTDLNVDGEDATGAAYSVRSADHLAAMWYKILSAADASCTVDAEISSETELDIDAIAFKEAPGGGGSIMPLLMSARRRRVA